MCLILRDRGLFKVVMIFALANSTNVKDKQRQTGILSIERGWCHCLCVYAVSILFKQATAVTPVARAHLSGWSCTGICVLRSFIPGVFLWLSHWEWMYSGPKNLFFTYTYIKKCMNGIALIMCWYKNSVWYGKLIIFIRYLP